MPDPASMEYRFALTIPFWVGRGVTDASAGLYTNLLALALDILLVWLSYRAVAEHARKDPSFGREGDFRKFLFVPTLLSAALALLDTLRLTRGYGVDA